MTNNTIKFKNVVKSIGNVKLNFKYNKDILNEIQTNRDYSVNITSNDSWCLLDTWYNNGGTWRRELSITDGSNETNTGYPTGLHRQLPYVPVINLCINNLGSNGSTGGYKYSEGITYEMFIDNEISYQNSKTCLIDENLSCLYYGYIFERGNILFNNVLEDYADIPTKPERMKRLREDMYYNSLQVKYAYAVTCHKAQGGQWAHIYIDQGYMTDDMLTPDYIHWLYTAFTRATEKLYLVNWPV